MLSGEYGHVRDLAGNEVRTLDGPEDWNNWLRETYGETKVRMVIMGFATGKVGDPDRQYFPYHEVFIYPHGHDCDEDGTGSCK